VYSQMRYNWHRASPVPIIPHLTIHRASPVYSLVHFVIVK